MLLLCSHLEENKYKLLSKLSIDFINRINAKKGFWISRLLNVPKDIKGKKLRIMTLFYF